jgi:hypothetical protein
MEDSPTPFIARSAMNPGQGNPHEKGGGVQHDETSRGHAEMPLPQGGTGSQILHSSWSTAGVQLTAT